MRFITGGRYRHDRCLDVDIEILKIQYLGPEYIKAKVAYLNRNWQNGNFVIDIDNVTIENEQYEYWKRIYEDKR